jgi:lipopolysaccharide biosynthesis glycosyltransferase
MKNLILQVQIPKDKNIRGFRRFKYLENLYKDSKESAIDYALSTKSDYLCITDFSNYPNWSATYQRYAMFDMLEYDYILYVDSDAIISKDCLNIFKMGIRGLGAVPDFDLENPDHLKRNEDLKKILNLKTITPFCCGVMITDLDWRVRMRERVLDIMEKNPSMGDQEIINKAQDGEEYYQLSSDWGAWYKDGKFINHYGGISRKKEFEEQHSTNRNSEFK